MMKKSWVFVLALHFLCSVSHANFVLKFTTDDPTTLSIGDTATIAVWGWVDDAAATGTNGLYEWTITAVTDVSDVIQVNYVNTPLQPDPVALPDSKGWNLNLNMTGNFDVGAIIQDDYSGPVESVTGVGTGDGDITNAANYTKLVTFGIEAIGEGTAEYSLSYIVGGLVDATYFRSVGGSAEFYTEGSDNVFTVVPEPSSMLLLSGLGVIGYLRRKKG